MKTGETADPGETAPLSEQQPALPCLQSVCPGNPQAHPHSFCGLRPGTGSVGRRVGFAGASESQSDRMSMPSAFALLL